jgi:hypothetical protein
MILAHKHQYLGQELLFSWFAAGCVIRKCTECEYSKSLFVVLPQFATFPVRLLNFKKHYCLWTIEIYHNAEYAFGELLEQVFD